MHFLMPHDGICLRRCLILIFKLASNVAIIVNFSKQGPVPHRQPHSQDALHIKLTGTPLGCRCPHTAHLACVVQPARELRWAAM